MIIGSLGVKVSKIIFLMKNVKRPKYVIMSRLDKVNTKKAVLWLVQTLQGLFAIFAGFLKRDKVRHSGTTQFCKYQITAGPNKYFFFCPRLNAGKKCCTSIYVGFSNQFQCHKMLGFD